MAEHRYAVGNVAVVVGDEDGDAVRFEMGPGRVLASLSWDEVSELQRALVTAEEGEARRRRQAESGDATMPAPDGSDERASARYEPLTPESL